MTTTSSSSSSNRGGASLPNELDINNIPDDPNDVKEFLYTFIDKILRWDILLPMSRGVALSDGDRQRTILLLRALDNLQLYPGLAEYLRLGGTLGVIRGDNTRIVFPQDIQDMASTTYDKFEAQNWGRVTVPNNPPQSSPSQGSNARPATTPAIMRRPPATHPIFGTNGIMRGLLIRQGAIRAYRFDDTFARGTPNNFGANGLTVGDWWPLQRCALRDGAHGSSQAGISGSQDHGAYSIVVSGLYSELDSDQGATLWYSASNSHENENPDDAPVSDGARALRRSLATQRPVRVLRTSGATASLAPAVGIRYDGLYRVLRERFNINARGGRYIRFLLDRLPNQPAINQPRRPTVAETREFNRIAGGY